MKRQLYIILALSILHFNACDSSKTEANKIETAQGINKKVLIHTFLLI
ncbi:hypothetical protein [Lacihabitans lacunae]|uniref:Uncharacterized protein n=1 Tax=Lacihabitans lacunae TaxID=1028214 RepID=A0ABV7YSP1_9BACT